MQAEPRTAESRDDERERAPFPHKHLLGIEGLTRRHVETILDTAEAMRGISDRRIKKVQTLRGRMVVNAFFENSTRTRISFEVAEKRLSADSVNIQVSGSAMAKGETLLDTLRNIEAMRPDMVVLRHWCSGAPHFLAHHLQSNVINAGDGNHEHPTQALLDAITIRRAKGRLDGLDVAICGDIAHSRVARSNAHLLRLFGSRVRVSGPGTMMPRGAAEALGVRVCRSLAEAVEGVDVVMMLRIQKERMGADMYPSDREYARQFGLTREVLRHAKRDAIVMHPGPMNRGLEIAPDVADGDRSVILDQVENGVAIRMAVLYLLSGASEVPAE
ncbi:MAG: aspartate carbamoyltransferase catalytic subunit [Deltaproteobacteria bacterium]|nr:aspartate carbamoyltransferase catalytic subunit [Deltaproteobacteria bacterium]